jgi:hypothetical protein
MSARWSCRPPHPMEVTMRDHGTAKRILSAATDNWISRGYLAVCAGLLIWVALDALFTPHAEASFAGIWPILATSPTSLVLIAVELGLKPLLPSSAATPLFLVLLALAAYVNAALFGLLLRRIRPRTSAV